METKVKSIRTDRTKMKVYKKIGVFEWALCKMVASLLPDCIVGMDILSSLAWYCKTGQVNPPFRQC